MMRTTATTTTMVTIAFVVATIATTISTTTCCCTAFLVHHNNPTHISVRNDRLNNNSRRVGMRLSSTSTTLLASNRRWNDMIHNDDDSNNNNNNQPAGSLQQLEQQELYPSSTVGTTSTFFPINDAANNRKMIPPTAVALVSIMSSWMMFDTNIVVNAMDIGSVTTTTTTAVLDVVSSSTTTISDSSSFLLSPSINSALLAYSHYVCILLATILLCYERFLLEATSYMTDEQEKSLVIADALYGLVGVGLFGTGYFRIVSEYGKGWEYYSHEPLFWVKICAVSLLGGLSLFPTITLIQRGNKLFKNESVEPMSMALRTRMKKVLNAELSAILSIPLFATFMARGVGYNPDFPWPLGAVIAVITLFGSGYVYAQQALKWTDDTTTNEQV